MIAGETPVIIQPVRVYVLVVLVLAISTARARADRWTKRDTAIQLTLTTTLVLDYLQTRKIVEDFGYDGNPIIGCGGAVRTADCSGMSIELYFASAAIIGAGVAFALPRPWRYVFQGIVIGAQLVTIERNYSGGYGFSF